MADRMSFIGAGLDVHADSVCVCAMRGGEVIRELALPHDPERVIAQLRSDGVARCVYEAGPTGYGLQRAIEAAGIECMVVAPGRVPQQPGDRIKTDRRDARKLAMLLMGGLLESIFVPPADSEAIRSLVRARDDIRRDRYRARQRMSAFLLRHGLRPPTTCWGPTRMLWLAQRTFDHGPDQITFADYLHAIELVDRRLERIDREIEWVAEHSKYAPMVGRLRCLRGIDTLTAIGIASEIGDFSRFRTANEFMSYVGLVPSEYSSGERKMRGGLTKTGNGHVRRLLVEASWNTRGRPMIGTRLRHRQQCQPPWAIEHAWRCQHRLYKKWGKLIARKRHPNTAVCAVARELSGFVWAIATCQPIR